MYVSPSSFECEFSTPFPPLLPAFPPASYWGSFKHNGLCPQVCLQPSCMGRLSEACNCIFCVDPPSHRKKTKLTYYTHLVSLDSLESIVVTAVLHEVYIPKRSLPQSTLKLSIFDGVRRGIQVSGGCSAVRHTRNKRILDCAGPAGIAPS